VFQRQLPQRLHEEERGEEKGKARSLRAGWITLRKRGVFNRGV